MLQKFTFSAHALILILHHHGYSAHTPNKKDRHKQILQNISTTVNSLQLSSPLSALPDEVSHSEKC